MLVSVRYCFDPFRNGGCSIMLFHSVPKDPKKGFLFGGMLGTKSNLLLGLGTNSDSVRFQLTKG